MHRSRLFKTLKVLVLSVALFSLSVADALAISDGSEWRFRLIQGANFGDGVELGSYKVGSKSYEMRSHPSKNIGLMLVVGSWGLGYYDFQTEINQTDALLTQSRC